MTQTPHYRKQIQERKGKGRGWEYYTLQFTSELFLFLHYIEKRCFLLNHWSFFSPKHPTSKLGHPEPLEWHDLGFQAQRVKAQHYRTPMLSVTAPAERLSGSAAAQPAQRQAWLAKILCRNWISNLYLAHSHPINLAGQDEGERRIKRFLS